jgi:hypothetical protein
VVGGGALPPARRLGGDLRRGGRPARGRVRARAARPTSASSAPKGRGRRWLPKS